MISTTDTKPCGRAFSTADLICNLPRGHKPGHAYSTGRPRAERRTAILMQEETAAIIEAEVIRARAYGNVTPSVLAFGIVTKLIEAGLVDAE